MADFDPVEILRTLVAHDVEFVVIGGLAAVLRGTPLVTRDVDITPSTLGGNMDRLAKALEHLGAKLRTEKEPAGVAIPFDPGLLRSARIWTLTTKHGNLDLVMDPAGTQGYPDLIRGADGLTVSRDPELIVSVASLEDVIRSKEAAGREKDRQPNALPLIRRTLEELKSRDEG